jgi:hypothetical protein
MDEEKFLEVEDLNGCRYLLYSADVCCGKALLIRKDDRKFYVKQIVDLRAIIR